MDRTSKLFWPGVIVGWAIIGVGIAQLVGEGRDVPALAFTRWLVGLALVHDLVLVPVVLAAGAVLRRALQPPWRSTVGGALVVIGPVVLFAWPFVARWGRLRSNPSILPRDYGRGLLVIVAAIAVTSAAVGIVATSRRARARQTAASP